MGLNCIQTYVVGRWAYELPRFSVCQDSEVGHSFPRFGYLRSFSPTCRQNWFRDIRVNLWDASFSCVHLSSKVISGSSLEMVCLLSLSPLQVRRNVHAPMNLQLLLSIGFFGLVSLATRMSETSRRSFSVFFSYFRMYEFVMKFKN